MGQGFTSESVDLYTFESAGPRQLASIPKTLGDDNGLTIGQRANVTVGSLPGKTFVATLRELSPAADPQSRSFRAKFTIANPSPE